MKLTKFEVSCHLLWNTRKGRPEVAQCILTNFRNGEILIISINLGAILIRWNAKNTVFTTIILIMIGRCGQIHVMVPRAWNREYVFESKEGNSMLKGTAAAYFKHFTSCLVYYARSSFVNPDQNEFSSRTLKTHLHILQFITTQMTRWLKTFLTDKLFTQHTLYHGSRCPDVARG